MVLDPRTLIFALVAAALLMALTLALGVRGRAPGLGRWTASLVLLALGWSFAGLRGSVSPALSVALADALILAGLAWQLGALAELEGRAASMLTLAAPAAIVFVALLALIDHPAIRTGVSAFALAVALTMLARTWLEQRPAGALRGAVAAFLFLATLPPLLVAIDVGLEAVGVRGTGSEGALRSAQVALFLAVVVATSAAFLALLRAEVEARLERTASRDALTGLYHRHEFEALAAREWARAGRSGAPFVLLRADLGTGVDDSALAEAGHVLAAQLRADDFAGRWDEELGIFLSGATRQTAPVVAERLRAALQASVGVAVCETGALKLEEVLAMAEEALHEAKAGGGNSIALRVGGDAGKRPVPRRRVLPRPGEPLLR